MSCVHPLLLFRCVAPPPPPRSSSRVNDQAQQLMLLSSLTAAALASARNATGPGPASVMRSNSVPASGGHPGQRSKSTAPINNNNCMILNQGTIDSVDSQDSVQISDSNSSLASIDSQNGRSRQQLLEDRHQELLKKQRLLQDQYTQLQLLSRGQQGLLNDLKKTGSESNIVLKSGLGVNSSGSLSQLIPNASKAKTLPHQQTSPSGSQTMSNGSKQMSQTNGNQVDNNSTVQMNNNQAKHVETQKIYETDIL